MQPRTRSSLRNRRPQQAPASFSLLALLLLAGSASFAACGDDGSVLGVETSAGSSGQASAGNASSAGSAHAGARASAGVNGGGTTSNGGEASAGGATCETSVCLRANVCLDECGGNVVSSGCCDCGPGTVEELSCLGSGGQGSGGQGSGGQASSACVGKTCTASQTCVAYRTVGGIMVPPDDDGKCDAGRHLEGDTCQADFDYTCAELTGCNAPAATCRCAPNTECADTIACRLPSDSASLDASAQLVCELLAP